MIPRLLPLLAFLSVPLGAQTLVFSENFGTLADSTAVTNTTTDFNYRTGYGTVAITNPSGTNAALEITSTGSGNVVTGLGVSGLTASSVYTVSFSVNLSQLPGGTSLRFAMGQSGGTLYPAQGANPPRIDNSTNYAAWAAQSLFVVNLGGNGALGSDFGLLGSMDSTGSFTQVDNSVVFSPGATHTIRLVANGGTGSITLGAATVGAGQLGVYVDETFVGSVVMSNSVAADEFVIYSHGRSANGDFAQGIIDNVQVWQGAIAPIPEPASVAALLGATVLAGAALRLRRR